MTFRLFAISLMLLSVTGLSACNRTEETRISREETTVEPDERTAATTQEDATAERPVGANQRDSLSNLEAGRQVSYYTQEMENRGYRVRNADYRDDRVVYQADKDNRTHEVTLMLSEDGRRVERVMERDARQMESAFRENPEAQRISQQVQQLQPGKKAVEYIPTVSQWGRVTEYELDRDEAKIAFEANNRRYQINMDVDPNTQVVRTIEMQRHFWDRT